MPLDRSKCVTQKVWCGKGSLPHGNGYSRAGTPFECLQQGFGAGKYSEKEKHLPFDSLQRIKYVGETHEASFKKEKIRNLKDLTSFAKDNPSKLERMLKKVLMKKDDRLDVRAYNHVLLWLDDQRVSKLPSCVVEN
jgi:hypothetical protein